MDSSEAMVDAKAFVYHGTDMNRLASISEKGLLPHPPPDYCWPEFDDIIEESDDDEPELPPEAFEPRLFATNRLRAATGYAANNAEPLVLRILEDAVDWRSGETDEDYLFTTAPISPDLIQVQKGSDWIPIAEFLADHRPTEKSSLN